MSSCSTVDTTWCSGAVTGRGCNVGLSPLRSKVLDPRSLVLCLRIDVVQMRYQ